MRARELALLGFVFAAGCLVPAYEATLPDQAQAGTGATSATAGSGTTGATSGAGSDDCTSSQKRCGGACVEIDDPSYGCGDTSCDAAACPATAGELACEGGQCVEGSCAAGSKRCDGKCVSMADPTYGCGPTSCDASACPAPGQGAIVCNGSSCEVGTCGADTKECDGKCVPLDRNHGCAAASCEACESSETCEGSPTACTCVPENVCVGKQCGTFTDRCGKEVGCFDICPDSTPACDANGQCVQCVEAADCPVGPTNPCAVPLCLDNTCQYRVAPANTTCGGGTCSSEVIAVCEFAPVTTSSGVSIDPTEVTRYQYLQFLGAKAGDMSGQPSVCNWNDSYEPVPLEIEWLEYNRPITGVDWCDARAYCEHVGRRLCGKVGGGAVPFGDYADPAVSQWMRACAGSNGFNAYSYGPNYYSTVCHDATTYVDRPYLDYATADVGSFPGCESVGANGLFDMGGNVAEWEDSCNSSFGSNDQCRIRGGSFGSNEIAETQLRCDNPGASNRGTTSPGIGFRCCG